MKITILIIVMTSTLAHSQVFKMIESEQVYTTSAFGFSQAVPSNNLLFLSGQVGWDTDYNLTGDKGFEAQVKKTFENIERILEKGESNISNIVSMRIYVKQLSTEKRIIVGQYLKQYFSGEYKPSTSLIGITTLAREDLLIEIEAIATVIE